MCEVEPGIRTTGIDGKEVLEQREQGASWQGSWKGKDDASEAEIVRWSLQGESGVGGDSGTEDGERVGGAAQGASDTDHVVEEATFGRRGDGVRVWCCQKGRCRRTQLGRALRADWSAEDRTGLGQKKWPSTVAERRAWIDPGDRHVSVRQQCAFLGLHRSNVYYEPVPENLENLALMRLIDEEYLRHPFLGSRRMVLWLASQGHVVNRKKVQRLLGKIGLQGIAPG